MSFQQQQDGQRVVSETLVAGQPYRVRAARYQMLRLVQGAADQHGLNFRDFLVLPLAESDLDWNARNLADGKYGSWGLCQQHIEYSDEYVRGIAVPEVIRLYLNPRYALDIAARKFTYWLEREQDVVNACLRYNGPSLDPKKRDDPQRRLYTHCYGKAALILDGQRPDYPWPDPPEES